jgi:tetratricopeptide (TPR) repeat protein
MPALTPPGVGAIVYTVLGSPSDDDPGATEGTPAPAPLTRGSLASRVDAYLASEDDDEIDVGSGMRPLPQPPAVRPEARMPPERIQPELSEATIDLDDLDEVSQPIATNIPPKAPPKLPSVAPPPIPRVGIARIPMVKVPATAAKPASRPTPIPLSIPPLGPPPSISVPTFKEPASDLATSNSMEDSASFEGEMPSRIHVDVEDVAPPMAPARPPTAPPARPPTAPPPPAEVSDEDVTQRPVNEAPRTRPPSNPPPIPGRARRHSAPPESDYHEQHTPPPADLEDGSIEVGVDTPNIVVDQPLEAHLESPTVIDRALAELGDAGGEARAAAMAKELDATLDPAAGAFLAYELGEHYERRLADEARAVKSYGKALSLDASLRPNLWAIRRVFYRRGLWPNLTKLIGAEVEYARDDHERADLLLEKARVSANHANNLQEAREALDEAVRIAPAHQGALLELERVVAKSGDAAALLDVWELLAEAVEHPVRKVTYWLEVGRAAASEKGGKDYARAQAAFERAEQLAGLGDPGLAERVAREKLRIAELHGGPADIVASIDALATLLLAAFGLAGSPAELSLAQEGATERATQIRREIVALRRRQAQLVRAETPDQAWDVLQQALALAPGEPLVLADLTELAEELGRYDDLAELVQSWQAVEGDPGRAMALSIRRADALLRGGQRDQARALLQSLEATAPGFIVLTSAAERDALAGNNPADLAATYLTAAQAAQLGTWLGPGQTPTPDPNAAIALYVQAAELLAYEVGGEQAIEDARSALGKALELPGASTVALEALTELDDATGNLGPALARLQAAAEAAENVDTKRAIHDRAIRLARSHGDLESALALERANVALAPTDLPQLWRLESTLAQLGRDDDRAQVLSDLAVAETDATRRGTAFLAAARLRERGGQVETATDLYRQVLALWPDDAFARESLIDLLRAQERWAELVTERRGEARSLSDAAARRALREAAWVLEVRANDPAQAAQVYDEWLARLPDDRAALEGSARCRAAFGDRIGEVTTRRQIAELDPTPETQWLLARALERAGQFDEAADVYRALAVSEEPSVAATSAALALADLAAGRADTVMRVEAAATLAGRTTEPRLGAALAEDSGWMYALVLEDFDRAGQSFEAAVQLEPGRRGALLGAALVAARRGDPVALAAAYDGLATTLQMPDAAAALHLRAAATALAGGDVELANHRIAAARTHAPDDTSALLVLAETGVTQTGDGDAVSQLLDRAEVLEMRSALADDAAARASWELDRAEALELAGRLREAAGVVAAVLKVDPSDIRALEAIRRMAKRAGDDRAAAQASYQLARVLGDPAAKLELLRDAATVLDDGSASATSTPGTSDHALAVYRRILLVDPGAPEHARLLDLLRQRADVRGLVTALTERLNWLESEAQDLARDQQMVPLLLERATVLHGLGDQQAAMGDLDALLDRAASHVEALRFRADLALNAGEADLAVSLWKRCLAAETRPQRRSEIELQLAKVLAENTNDVEGAIENLEKVVASKPDDLQLRERLLGLCLRANDWQRAARELRALAQMRPTPAEKARDELRLGLMLRDRLNERNQARLALERGRSLDPLNLDVVRELSELLDPPARAQMLANAAASFRTSIASAASNAQLYDRLAQITGWQSDVDARWLALVRLEAFGTPSVDQRQVLEQGRHKLGAPNRTKLDDSARKAIRGELGGALLELWRTIAPAVQVATGVDAGKLGFSRGDKLPVKKLGDKYEILASALANFGIEDVEIYVSAARAGIVRVLAAETPVLCIGADVAAAKMPHHRWLLGRAVATLAEGLATLTDLRDGELGWTLVAALRASEVTVPPRLAEEAAGEDASIVERAKLLKKELGRKQRAAVAQIVQARGAELVDLAGFRRHALGVTNRAGLLWCGDLAVTLAQLDVGKGGKAISDSPAALEITAWSVSDQHLRLRQLLGIGLGGSR